MAVVGRDPARILISVIQHYIDGAGGSSRLAYDEALHLRDQGHEVWMLASSDSDDLPEHEHRDGFHYLRYRYRRLGAFDPRRMFSYQRDIFDILRRHAPKQFDVVHGHGPLQHLAVCSYFAEGPRRCLSIHSPVVDEILANVRGGGLRAYGRHVFGVPFLQRIELRCLRNADWINAFSNFTVGKMRQYHGNVADRIEVVPGWTDLGRFRILNDRHGAKLQLGWNTDRPVLFTLRRLVPRMGLDHLIKAASMLAENGYKFQLVIGGRGPLRGELESLARGLGVSDTVSFAGFVPDETLPLMYGACDAFVLPTAALECFGIIAVEALAAGRPVLATPVAAIPEIMNRVEPAWLARDESPEGIRDLLGDFLSGRLPNHDDSALRSLAETYWDSKRMLEVFCNEVLGRDSVLVQRRSAT